MNRLVIALLAALDALITAAVGLGVVLAPLAVFWATTGGGWGLLWPTSAKIWQAGHLVPLHVALPDTAIAATGVAADASSFVLSLAPLAFATFAAYSAVRSGVRANVSGGWVSGFLGGAATFTAIAALVALTSHTSAVRVDPVAAIAFPSLVYAVPLLVGALVSAWRDGDGGVIDALHDRLDALSEQWSELPALAGRGIAMIGAFFLAFGALAVVVSLVVRGGEMIALFQSNRVDLWGAILLTLVHLAYLPTLIVWGASWVAGPGFQVGSGSTFSPAASDPGVLPSLPMFTLLPDGGSVWMLAVVLLPLAAAVFVGWALRSRYVAVVGDDEPIAARLTLTVTIAAASAGIAALAAVVASGSIGPGRLAHVGPHPGSVALAVGVEVLVGVAVMMLSPRGERSVGDEPPAFDDGRGTSDSESEARSARR